MFLDINNHLEVEKYILRIFNYYNGKINICNNPARLIINWSKPIGYYNGGCTGNPNIIIVHPMIIYEWTTPEENEWFKYNIWTTIIHELHHIDQDSHYIKEYTRNPEYIKSVEFPVEVLTTIYTAQHINEAKMFDIKTISYNDYIKVMNETGWFLEYYPYKRRTYFSHLFSIIEEMLGTPPANVILSLITDNTVKNVYLSINGNLYDGDIKLKNGYKVASIKTLNDFFYSVYFQYSFRGARIIDVQINDNSDEYTFIISTTTHDIMYRLIDTK